VATVVRTYAEIDAAARDGSPFSNGTEGYAWMSKWCDRCKNNDEEREIWCDILSVALLGKTPSEWFEQSWGQVEGEPEGVVAPSLYDRYHCVEFRDEDGAGDTEPKPIPDPPDQEILFPREQAEGVRMLTVEPVRTEVSA
jgi:hypothetical protein